MTVPTDDQLEALGAAFAAFSRRYKLAEAAGPGRPLTELDKQVLLYVAEHQRCRPSDIARFLGVRNTTISSATDRLVKQGLLARDRPDADRRAVSLQLTKKGKAGVASVLASLREMSQRMLEPLSGPERARFIALITKIVSHEG